MTRYESNTKVGGGYYFNTTSWSLHAVDGERGELPGVTGTRWVRLATPVMIVAAAVVSLGFVLFLPVIGLLLLGKAVGEALLHRLGKAAQALAHTFAPQWRPGEAWLTRRAAPHEEHAAPAPEELRKAVETRRADEAPPAP